MRNGIFAALIAIAVLGAFLVFSYLPERADRRMNVVAPSQTTVSAQALAFHRTLRIADLHADTLLWMRDPVKRQTRGQTDVPRLKDGGFRLQVFSAVTKTPRNQNYDENTGDTDNITILAFAQRWPVKTWTSLYERTLYQSARLHDAERRSDGALKVVRSAADLDAALADGALAGVLATEGAHPLEGKLENVAGLFDAGYRVLGLHHFFDNELGGSLHGIGNKGLTRFGEDALAAAQSLGMIIDVAHSSEAVV
ncbi:MAG: membrane dipeptidase, partial [Pseudomonadota bacterium]